MFRAMILSAFKASGQPAAAAVASDSARMLTLFGVTEKRAFSNLTSVLDGGQGLLVRHLSPASEKYRPALLVLRLTAMS